MGEKDLRRGARWLGIAASALGLAAATALAAPPDGDFTVKPDPPNRGEEALFRCQPCPDPTSVSWDLDGDLSFETSGRTATTTFATAGPHTVSMRLTRDEEETTITKTVTVNAPPSVTFSFDPESPLAGQEVGFQSQVTDPEDDPVAREWDFGDGTTGTGAAPSHAYGAAGAYTVKVTATDSHGATGSASKSIVVQADPGPTSSFDFTPAVPDVGATVTFTSTSHASQGAITDLNWDLDGVGGFDDFSGPVAQATFDSPGTHVVRLRAEQTGGEFAVGQASVRVNAPPVADFSWDPPNPVAGDVVELTSTSSDLEGPLASVSWDLDGDGEFDDGGDPAVRQLFLEPPNYDIGLRVTDSDGTVRTVHKHVPVVPSPVTPPGGPPTGTTVPPTGTTGPPAGTTVPPTGTTAPSATPAPLLMSPFPIIRIAGTVRPHAAVISVLSVRAPRGAHIRVRCVGRGCPVGSFAMTSASRLVRLHKFERRLHAGTRLKLFVGQGGRIGKYTSFLIRAGAPPKRVDLCLYPAGRSVRRCP